MKNLHEIQNFHLYNVTTVSLTIVNYSRLKYLGGTDEELA